MFNSDVNKFLSAILLITLLSHLSFIHHLMDNYVLCRGADGHIAIENIYGNDSCNLYDAEQTGQAPGTVQFQNRDCLDYSLQQFCFEDNQFIGDKKILTVNPLLFSETVIPPYKIQDFFNSNPGFFQVGNVSLSNYSTVCLLI